MNFKKTSNIFKEFKRKRALSKLKAAKKQATLMAENSEMSEKQKLKVFI